MLNIILGIIIGIVLIHVRSAIAKSIKNVTKHSEKFDINKFKKNFVLFDKVEWIKDLSHLFNIRKLIIYSIIFMCIYGWGYYKGKLNTPIKVNLSYEKAFKIKIDHSYLYKPKNSQELWILDEEGNKIKKVTVGDIKELQNKLKPYGFCFEPYFSIGYALTDKKAKIDYGIGINWLKYFRWRISNWLSNNGIWLGVSYKITDNFGMGAGIGKGFKGDNLVGFQAQWRF